MLTIMIKCCLDKKYAHVPRVSNSAGVSREYPERTKWDKKPLYTPPEFPDIYWKLYLEIVG